MAHEEACLSLVGRTISRRWILFLAASALNFEAGLTEVHQALLSKRFSPRRTRWSRRYMYA